MVLEIFSEDALYSELRTANGLVVVDFYADWCAPCRSIAPIFTELSLKYTDVKFIKINSDKNPFCTSKLGISSLPTFHFYIRDTLIDSMQGAAPPTLEAKLIKHSLTAIHSNTHLLVNQSNQAIPMNNNISALSDDKQITLLLPSTHINHLSPQTIPQSSSKEASSLSSINEEFFNAVKYSLRAQTFLFLQESPELTNIKDEDGISPVHFAARNNDIDILKCFKEFNANLSQTTDDDDQDTPLHWAASNGSIKAIKYLLDNHCHVDSLDSNGSTPLISAIKNNQINTIIFLIKYGKADIHMKDNIDDTPFHWAAHSGFDQILSLLFYFSLDNTNALTSLDQYGQSVLHLASLKGHVDVVNYLLKYTKVTFNDYKYAHLYHADHDGDTPLDLAIKKKKYKVEWLLRRAMYGNNTISILLSIGYSRLLSTMGVFLPIALFGINLMEQSCLAWRVVFWSMVIATISTIKLATEIDMWTPNQYLYILQSMNIIFQILWYYFFISCLTHPGHVREPVSKGQYSYGLDAIGYDKQDASNYNLCHTCRVRRPLRSKHDRAINQCIYKFDHFCPYVGNAVGRDNYRYFIGLLVTHTIGAIIWEILAAVYAAKHSTSWLFTCFRLYALLMLILVAFLSYTHFKLIRLNCTTNEIINRDRYDYLKIKNREQIINLFLKKSFLLNVLDVFYPDKRVFYTRDEVMEAENGGKPYNSPAAASLV